MEESDTAIDGIRELLSTIFDDDVLVGYLAQMLYDEGTDTDSAWEMLETFLLDAGVAGPTCRAVKMQLALIAPLSPNDCEPQALDCEPQLLEKAVVMSDLLPVASTPSLSKKTHEERSVELEEKARKAKLEIFEVTRQKFLQRHERLICENINRTFPGQLQLSASPLSDDVKMLFMAGVNRKGRQDRKHTWIPVLHGTNASNHTSIFKRGLLIPGDGNTLKVVHGAAHGRGVYTAGLHASWLSKGFCTEPRMLVCAVLVGGDLRYARDAIIVRNSKHVVPLFEAKWVDE